VPGSRRRHGLPSVRQRLPCQTIIASFRGKALERFWWRGEARRIDPKHVRKVEQVLSDLEVATEPAEMNLPSYHWHALSGNLAGRWSIRVDRNWRITFGWSSAGPDAVDVDYEDYH
jgi:toxin HigB-1